MGIGLRTFISKRIWILLTIWRPGFGHMVVQFPVCQLVLVVPIVVPHVLQGNKMPRLFRSEILVTVRLRCSAKRIKTSTCKLHALV